jgi:hypothetical protein
LTLQGDRRQLHQIYRLIKQGPRLVGLALLTVGPDQQPLGEVAAPSQLNLVGGEAIGITRAKKFGVDRGRFGLLEDKT